MKPRVLFLFAAAAVCLFASAVISGCRIVANTNEYHAGTSIEFKGTNAQEGTQAADKKVGDITPTVDTVLPIGGP